LMAAGMLRVTDLTPGSANPYAAAASATDDTYTYQADLKACRDDLVPFISEAGRGVVTREGCTHSLPGVRLVYTWTSEWSAA
jgi:hypothetical protein